MKKLVYGALAVLAFAALALVESSSRRHPECTR